MNAMAGYDMIILCFYVIILMDGCWLSAQLRLGQTVKFYQSVNYVYRERPSQRDGERKRGRGGEVERGQKSRVVVDNFLNLCRCWQLPRAANKLGRHTPKKNREEKIEIK